MYIVFLPYYYLAFFLYASYNFDRFVNKELYPEIYDKGIVRKEAPKVNNVPTYNPNEEYDYSHIESTNSESVDNESN